MSEIKDRKVELALKWAKSKQSDLDKIGSDLLFNLHKAKFSQLLQKAVDL